MAENQIVTGVFLGPYKWNRLRWWLLKNFGSFSPRVPGEMIQFDGSHIFPPGLVNQPPTSKFMASQPTPPQRTAPTEIAGRLWILGVWKPIKSP